LGRDFDGDIMTGKVRLKRIENDALQAIKCLTTARSGGRWTAYNLRAIALMFEAVVGHLRQVADEMDKQEKTPQRN
jgi:hypothetical protein